MLLFCDLREALRTLLWDRVKSGELTEMALADKTGFCQAHISNFLSRKRGLQSMDRVLTVEEFSVLDLVPPNEINQRASIPPPHEDDYANVLLVGPQHAALPFVPARDVLEVVKFKHSFLRRMRADDESNRTDWLRFLLMKPSRACCEAMSPRLASGCTVLLDRYYHSLTPYRRGEQTMYAVLNGGEAVIRYVTFTDDTLVLRPAAADVPVTLLRVPEDRSPADLIIGRVAFTSMET